MKPDRLGATSHRPTVIAIKLTTIFGGYQLQAPTVTVRFIEFRSAGFISACIQTCLTVFP
jgi:hypothetical protein